MFGIILLSPILRLLHLLSITFAPFMLGKLLRIVHSFQRPEISTIKNLQLNVATTKTETMKDLKTWFYQAKESENKYTSTSV